MGYLLVNQTRSQRQRRETGPSLVGVAREAKVNEIAEQMREEAKWGLIQMALGFVLDLLVGGYVTALLLLYL